ncbi:MFS transporter [Arthrobacter gallicola]|nr:MFS transporter [Arthrobacter gallicola]
MRNLVISGMALIAAVYGLARFGYGLFLPRFTETFDLGSAVSGTIQAGSFASYCVAAVLAAGLGARPRLVIGLAGATAALGSAAVAAAPGPGVLAAGLVLAGAGAGFASPGLVTLIGRNISPGRQERAQTIVNAGTGAGIVGAGILMLLTAAQWRAGWAVIAVLAALTAAAVLRADSARADSTRADSARPTASSGRAGADGGPPAEARGGNSISLARTLAWPLTAAALAGASSAAVWTFGRTVTAAAPDYGGDAYSIGAWMVLGAFGVLGAFAGRIVQALSLAAAWALTSASMAAATIALGLFPGVLPAAYAAAAVFGAAYTAMSGVLILWAVRLMPERASTATVAAFVALAVGQSVSAVVLGFLLNPVEPAAAFTAAGLAGFLAVLPAVKDRAADKVRFRTPQRRSAGSAAEPDPAPVRKPS